MTEKYTFKRSLRLRKKRDFQYVYKHGKAYVDYCSILYIFKSNNKKTSKIGIAVGKKLGNAVVRNKIKRFMREIYRHNSFKIKHGYSLIWIARKPLVNSKINIFDKSFKKIFNKANIFIDEKDSD